MNTASDENIIEDLTTLVARDVGANEPDMSTNDLSYVDVQDLFATYQDNGKRGQKKAVEETVAIASPLDALKEIILALDWDVSSSNLKKCQAEIEVFLKGCQDDQYSMALLKMLSTIVKYLGEEKGNAHPDSVKVLTSVYVCLEKITSSLVMDAADKNQAVAKEVIKFKTLRQKIAKNIKGRKATGGEERGPREIDALIPLKAMVLSIDWGEISQERIDAFFAEIAALKKQWQTEGTLVQGLEILRAYGQYIFVKKEYAHPDSFSQLFASYNSLERVLASDHLTPADKKDIISLELQKFIALKKQITPGKEESTETTAPLYVVHPTKTPIADLHDTAGKEGKTRQQAESGQAALFMTAVDTRLDDFFAEKDATHAAALQVAELPRYESTSSSDEGAPAAMSDDVVLPMAGGDEGPALFMEGANAPTEDLGVSDQNEQREILPEPDLNITYDQGLDFDRAAKEATVAEELFAAGGASEQEALSAPASACPPWLWLGDLAPLITGLQGQCSDTAVAVLRREIATVSTRQALPPAASIALDLLSAVTAQLAALAEGDRAEGAALLESLRARLTTAGAGNEASTDASALPIIQSLVHDYVVWQSEAIRLVSSRYPTARPSSTPAPPTAAEQQAAKAPALAEEAPSGPAAPPKTRTRQDRTAPTGSFFERIRQLFKK